MQKIRIYSQNCTYLYIIGLYLCIISYYIAIIITDNKTVHIRFYSYKKNYNNNKILFKKEYKVEGGLLLSIPRAELPHPLKYPERRRSIGSRKPRTLLPRHA